MYISPLASEKTCEGKLIDDPRKAIQETFGLSVPEPIEIVCAGGTSMIGGFIEVFQDEFNSVNFPIEVKNIRRAEDPLYSVSKGCLVAALSDE